MPSILVTGGAGYVGSHMVRMLVDKGCHVVVVDDLRQGHWAAVPPGVELLVEDVGNFDFMNALLAFRPWHAVVHFAALSLVGESMTDPLRYMRQNAASGFALIDAVVKNKVPRFILSSTANVYGDPEVVPVRETNRIAPSSPYGESKWMIEQALRWAGECHGLRYAVLRYFNAAGADPEGRLGEDHTPETHLIPSIIDAALGRREPLTVFGTDYPTPDGTCIRDYIHVTDLCEAHLIALRRLDEKSAVYNLGNGAGHSVQDVIAAAEAVSTLKVPIQIGDRRSGDPAILVASSDRILQDMGWQPRYTQLADIVRSAYTWRLRHPLGYGDR